MTFILYDGDSYVGTIQQYPHYPHCYRLFDLDDNLLMSFTRNGFRINYNRTPIKSIKVNEKDCLDSLHLLLVQIFIELLSQK